MKKRNNGIDLMRFVFCLIVIIYHGGVFSNSGAKLFGMGNIAVEFFFVVSGFLMANSIYSVKETQVQNIGEDTFRFMKKKLKSFFPYHTFTFIVSIIAVAVTVGKFTVGWFGDYLVSSIPNFFYLEMAGLYDNKVNRAEWYISAMLIAMLIIYPIFRKNYDRFVKIIAPAISIFTYAILYSQFDSLTGVRAKLWFLPEGFFRALCEISFGAICFEISNRISKGNITKPKKVFFSVLEATCYIGAIGYMTGEKMNKNEELFCFLLLSAAVTVTFSGLSVSGSILKGSVWQKLGAFSYPLYLSQMAARQIVLSLSGLNRYAIRLPVYILITVCLAVLCMVVTNNIMKLINKKDKTVEG